MSNAATATPAPPMETVRINLIVGRARARLSQELLAERSAVERATISRIERGAAQDIDVEKLERLANALGVATPRQGNWPSVPVARRYNRHGSPRTWANGRA